MSRYLVLICLSVVTSGAFAHTSKALVKEPCADELISQPYQGKTLILDANVIMNDEDALRKFPGAKIIIPSVLLEELDNNKTNLSVGVKVRAFVRELVYLTREKRTDSTIVLEDGTTIVLDTQDYSRALKGISLDRRKADNAGYLAAALHYKKLNENVLLVTDDLILEIKASSVGVEVESFKNKNRTIRSFTETTDQLEPVEITDAEMQRLLESNELPKPAGLEISPNEFVQFFSPSYPAGHHNVARYVFKRPENIYESGELSATDLTHAEFKLEEVPFEGTVRVFVDNDPVPELGQNSKEDGWYYDSSNNTVVFLGKAKAALSKESRIKVEGQIEPHRMARLKSFDELGLWGLQSRSLEQTMAVNLAMDLGNGIDCLIEEGKAGTSKTFNMVVAAMKLTELSRIHQVVLSRAPAPMGGYSSGYLPGDSDEKNMPWMEPYLDNLQVVQGARGGSEKPGKAGRPQIPKTWEILDYGFIRGRSLASSLISIDEFQNTRANEADSILTRISTGSAYMIMGDVSQVDPPLTIQNNGLTHLITMLTDPALTPEQRSRVGYIRLRKGVRHPFAEMVAELARKHRTAR